MNKKAAFPTIRLTDGQSAEISECNGFKVADFERLQFHAANSGGGTVTVSTRFNTQDGEDMGFSAEATLSPGETVVLERFSVEEVRVAVAGGACTVQVWGAEGV